MKPNEASKKLEFHSKQICHGCMHPSMVGWCENHCQLPEAFEMAISALEKQEQTKEIIPHRNYQYLSDYWCECGWHLGKYNDVKFCANCGRKINWEKRKYKLPEPYKEEEDG